MTEEEWLAATDPTPMLEFIRDNISDRKLRLFALECCSNLSEWLSDQRSRLALGLIEKSIDSPVSTSVFRNANEASLRAMEDAAGDSESAEFGHTKWHAASAVVHCAYIPFLWDNARDASREARQAEACYHFELTNPGESVPNPEPDATPGSIHVDLLHDIFGNPFRPVAVEPEWLTSTIIALAEGIYQERAFDRLPILADALQDAVCDNIDILTHCRSDAPHTRGCWVIDLLTGRT